LRRGEPGRLEATRPYETLSGDDGDDLLSGDAGLDKVEGGPGADTILLGDNEPVSSTLLLESGSGGPGSDLVSGGPGSDGVSGGEGDDRLVGGSGSDLLGGLGESGNDLMVGESGSDMLVGGQGKDLGFGGAGDDYWELWEPGKVGDVDLFLGGPGTERTSSFGLSGDRTRQVLLGQQGDDLLDGGDGDDVILGGPGQDWIQGLGGNDHLRGGPGSDVVDFPQILDSSIGVARNESAMHIDLQRGVATGLGRDRLSEFEHVLGGLGDDVLLGSSGPDFFYLDWLSRPDAHDRIDGRGGRDVLAPHPFGAPGPMVVDLTSGRVRIADPSFGLTQVTSIETVVGGDGSV
jgi:Ca2+-binding RTX toxin-like protein